jgi:hypothetical protein
MSSKGKLKTLQKVTKFTTSGIRLVLISGTILLAVACGRGSSSRTTVIPPVTPNGMSSGSLRKDSTFRNTSRTTSSGNSYHQSGTGYRSGSSYASPYPATATTTTQPKTTYSTQWDKSGKSTSTGGHSSSDAGSRIGSASHISTTTGGGAASKSSISTKGSSSTASGISRGGFGASAKSSSVSS